MPRIASFPPTPSPPAPPPADEAPEFPSSLSLIPLCNSRGSSYNQHPLLSLQLDPSLSILPSELSSYSTILPPTDLLAGLDPPPEGDYRPLFSPDAASRSSTATRRGDIYSVCSSAGPSPSECAHADADDRAAGDDDHGDEAAEEAYASLIRRVEEVLAYNDSTREHGEHEEDEEEDPETSLLRKVQEVLQSSDTAASPRCDADNSGPRRGRSLLVEDQQLAYRRAETPLADQQDSVHAESPAEAVCHQQQQHQLTPVRLAAVTAIDFSLADGTYADVMMTKTQRTPHGRAPPISPSPSPGGYSRQRSHAESVGREPRYLSASPPPPLPHATTRARDAHVRTYDDPGVGADYAVGGMARTDSDVSIHVPCIDYQSIVSEDTIIERQVSSLMAKYGVIDPNASRYHEPVSTHHTSSPAQSRPPSSPLPSPQSKLAATPLMSSRGATSFASVSTTSYSSASFADQLSLASLEYMARHALITPNRKGQQQQRYPSPLARQLAPAAERVISPRMGANGGGALRAPADEPMSEILDVERIRRLPKLGAVRASGLAGVRR
ncbi:hypothetical protein HDU87_003570 [Geranomyces variabilis]|uniref:Uncharacterized protein n=1 Tax=Geranomyces variabilis TaxID=109894 RepID=A0AAD5TL63_9FUNG|nr:hypothetical protein HDU87_003570 [Geranomyces variabilis]